MARTASQAPSLAFPVEGGLFLGGGSREMNRLSPLQSSAASHHDKSFKFYVRKSVPPGDVVTYYFTALLIAFTVTLSLACTNDETLEEAEEILQEGKN